jgi:hypothetical protein
MSEDFEKLNNLKEGEEVELSGWFEEGGPLVKKQGGYLFLFEVPQFGGEPMLVAEYGASEDEILALIKKANSFT